MGGILVKVLLPLLLPTAVYLLYTVVVTRHAADGSPIPWYRAPWMWLGITGAILAILSMLALALFEGSPAGSDYQPAQFRDGVLVPGAMDR